MAEATMPYTWAGCPRAIPDQAHFPCVDCRWALGPASTVAGDERAGSPTAAPAGKPS